MIMTGGTVMSGNELADERGMASVELHPEVAVRFSLSLLYSNNGCHRSID